MPVHKPHRKPVMAARVAKRKIRRWLIKLDRIFIQIELERKERK